MKITLLWAATGLIVGSTMVGQLSAASDKPVSGLDMQFANKASQGGTAEVKLGELALKNASSPDVKKFGQKMVDDHTKAGDKLKTIANKDNISLPPDMGAKEKATYDRFSRLQGADFDKAYMRDMVKDHKADVAEFQKEANGGKNSDLKQFASDTLPTLQEHLKMAEDIAAKVK
jgi:putative membrane protein